MNEGANVLDAGGPVFESERCRVADPPAGTNAVTIEEYD